MVRGEKGTEGWDSILQKLRDVLVDDGVRAGLSKVAATCSQAIHHCDLVGWLLLNVRKLIRSAATPNLTLVFALDPTEVGVVDVAPQVSMMCALCQ